MKHWLVLSPITIILLLTSCTSVSREITMQTETPTPTVVAHWTKTPTMTPVAVKPTVTPQVTATQEIKINEEDLKPYFSLMVDEKILGADIKGGIVVDRSLTVSNPPIYGITLPESIVARYLAESIYKAYLGDHPNISFEEYIKMIAEAQSAVRNNQSVDLSKIAVRLFANDKQDGNGYVQQEYYVVPWYTGVIPQEMDGIRMVAFKDLFVNLVRNTRVKNLTTINTDLGTGLGTNLDNDQLHLYIALTYNAPNPPTSANLLASNMSLLPWWLNYNNGQIKENRHSQVDEHIAKMLLSNGLIVLKTPN